MFSVDRTASELRTFAVRGQTLAKPLVFPVLLFHDLRRTDDLNYRRAGVAEGVIMKIGGWKTSQSLTSISRWIRDIDNPLLLLRLQWFQGMEVLAR